MLVSRGSEFKAMKGLQFSSLPVVDLNADREVVKKQLKFALTELGFFELHNVPGYDADELLYACKWFFSLPEQTLIDVLQSAYNPSNNTTYRGLALLPAKD